MRYEIKWGFSVKTNKDTDVSLLKMYFGDTFKKECSSGEYDLNDLFEVDVCGKVWVDLQSEAEFSKYEREISKKTAGFVKENMKEYGYKFLYSGILRNNVLERSGFDKENKILDLSVDKFVKCYKKISGKITTSDIMFKYNQMGFEVTEISPALEQVKG